MKAIVYRKYGATDVLEQQVLPKPEPSENELLIKVKSVEVTKTDCEMRSFNFAVKWFWLPLRLALGLFKPRRKVLGSYFSGEVVAVGCNVKEFSIGDAVFGSSGFSLGAYAEYISLPSDACLVKKPKELTFEQAAAIPLGGINALHYLQRVNIKKADKVLVNGAGASIGSFAVQIAKAMGAEVTAVDSSVKKAMLQEIGADHFIDYTKSSFLDTLEKYDVIFDMVPQSSYSGCIRLLKPNGRYLCANPTFIKMLRSVVTPIVTNKQVYFAFAPETKEYLIQLIELVEKQKILPAIDKVFSMERIIEAHQRVETEQRCGIVLLTINNE
ncbi:alcohol dehydrogenase [Thalassotalea insulae]|uniref:Alcohol dehydrogenase n=2 Tax=Thalassotalea insulae TaxID=2056778 RepID=A0ABQ6GNB4_9GAMM|nr:alcohol dehydrogenase [Thalassotalea insulae]